LGRIDEGDPLQPYGPLRRISLICWPRTILCPHLIPASTTAGTYTPEQDHKGSGGVFSDSGIAAPSAERKPDTDPTSHERENDDKIQKFPFGTVPANDCPRRKQDEQDRPRAHVRLPIDVVSFEGFRLTPNCDSLVFNSRQLAPERPKFLSGADTSQNISGKDIGVILVKDVSRVTPLPIFLNVGHNSRIPEEMDFHSAILAENGLVL